MRTPSARSTHPSWTDTGDEHRIRFHRSRSARPRQALRHDAGRGRRHLPGTAGRDLRFPRRQRRGKNDDAAHAVRPHPADRGHRADRWIRHLQAASRGEGEARLPGRRAFHPSAPHGSRVSQFHRGPLSHAPRAGAPAADGKAARPVRAGGPRRADRRIQPRNETEDRARIAPDPRAVGAAAGRAHQRAGPALRPAGQGPARGACGAGDDGAPVDSHPRGGAGAVPPDHDHRSGTPGRHRHRGRAPGADGKRPGNPRGSVPQADRGARVA